MCSHILSDIEVLCDNVAILKQGKLAHAGSLDELRARESNLIEIVAAGANEAVLRANLDGNAQVQTDASGLRIQVSNEKEIDAVIEAVRRANGKLVSVNPIKQSLEDLFL